jgi:type IV secretion system protein TrbI
MVAEDNLIKPELVKPKGIPPKKMIISVFGVIAFSAVVLSYFNSEESAPVTADGLARENASRLSDVDKAAMGGGQVAVTEAANGSGLPAEFRIGANGQTAGAPLPGQTLKVPDQNQNTSPVGQQRPTERDQVEAAREVEIMNKPMIVADHSDIPVLGAASRVVGKSDSTYSAIDKEIQIANERKLEHQNNSANSSSELIAALQSGSNTKSQTTTHSGNNNSFIKEFSGDGVSSSIKSNRLESRFSVMEGSIIPAVTTRDIISDIPGAITAMVNQNVYDSLTAKNLLICKGSKLVGRYNSEVVQGQSRLQFAFSRLILPDGQSFNLSGFNGTDQSGASGYAGDVDNHFFRIYGTSLAIGLLADQVTRPSAIPQGGINSQPSATGQVLIETTKQILQRHQNVSPTITISRGALINVEVRRDMVFNQPFNKACQ